MGAGGGPVVAIGGFSDGAYRMARSGSAAPGAPRGRRVEAFKVISEIRRKLLETYGPTDYDSAEEIRRWRDARR